MFLQLRAQVPVLKKAVLDEQANEEQLKVIFIGFLLVDYLNFFTEILVCLCVDMRINYTNLVEQQEMVMKRDRRICAIDQ